MRLRISNLRAYLFLAAPSLVFVICQRGSRLCGFPRNFKQIFNIFEEKT